MQQRKVRGVQRVRLDVKVPSGLKGRVERLAGLGGVSVSVWVVGVLGRAVDGEELRLGLGPLVEGLVEGGGDVPPAGVG